MICALMELAKVDSRLGQDEENDENKVVLPNCSKKAIVISSDTDEDTSKNEDHLQGCR